MLENVREMGFAQLEDFNRFLNQANQLTEYLHHRANSIKLRRTMSSFCLQRFLQ